MGSDPARGCSGDVEPAPTVGCVNRQPPAARHDRPRVLVRVDGLPRAGELLALVQVGDGDAWRGLVRYWLPFDRSVYIGIFGRRQLLPLDAEHLGSRLPA